MKKFLKEKWYLFSVWMIFFVLGMYWYINGTVKMRIIKLLDAIEIDIYANIYYFIHQDQYWISYIIEILLIAGNLILCALIGNFVLRRLTKKQIAISCTVYNVYALLTIGVLILNSFTIMNSFVRSNPFFYEMMSNCNSIVRIGITETDIGIVESTAYLILGTTFTGDEIGKYDVVFQVAFYIDLVVQFACPYLFVFFGKSGKDDKLNSNEN